MYDDEAALLGSSHHGGRDRGGVWIMDVSSLAWHKSTLSEANGCVEVASVDGGVAIRDSKDQSGPVLVFTPAEWKAFVAGVRAGEFDFPYQGFA